MQLPALSVRDCAASTSPARARTVEWLRGVVLQH
jgi:hypothetical protein